MRRWGLRAPIKDQLAAILQDYPGGQLLDEALQNAEDSWSTEFALMLDLREHGTLDTRLAGPAFVLFDNGRGLGEREWTRRGASCLSSSSHLSEFAPPVVPICVRVLFNLQNLHRSEKRDSPREIGRYGMGSRSYFHYGDVTAVLSRGKYVGLDPLDTVTSLGRGEGGGWLSDVSVDDASQEGLQEALREARQLFTVPTDVCSAAEGLFTPETRGAAFRLPLRRAAEVDEGLGGEIKISDAETMLTSWGETLTDGRVLLFLTSILRVSIWRWESGSSKPTCIVRVSKDKPSLFDRLPIPDTACQSYEALQRYIEGLDERSRTQLSHFKKQKIGVTTERLGANTTHVSWLVFQSFDCSTQEVYDQMMMAGSSVVPVVGIALPDDNRPLPSGGASCTLPIGDLRTGLPIHVNACFEVHKNRRNIWLPGSSLGHPHARWAAWNQTLMHHALPRLWRAVMIDISQSDLPPESVLAQLPDLTAVNAAWKPCAINLYVLLKDVAVLPHSAGDNKVRPMTSLVLTQPTLAFVALRDVLQQLYAYKPDLSHHVVFIPDYVEAAMVIHSGLKRLPVDEFIERWLLNLGTTPEQLAPLLLALAELADSWPPAQTERWRTLVSSYAWVPLVTGRFSRPSECFAPDQQHLIGTKLNIVVLQTANLMVLHTVPSAVLRTALAWGVKSELTWADVLFEADDVARRKDMDNAERLLKYLEERHGQLGGDKQSTLAKLNAVQFLPSAVPTKAFELTASKELLAPNEVLARAERESVWAVHSTSAAAYSFGIAHKALVSKNLVDQIKELAELAQSGKAGIPCHLLKAYTRLKQLHSDSLEEFKLALRPLRIFAWLPVSRTAAPDQLRAPRDTISSFSFDLWPAFSKPLEPWLALGTDFLEAAGVDFMLSAPRLVEALEQINNSVEGVLSPDEETLAINLMRELAERVRKEKTARLPRHGCFVLTRSKTMRRNLQTFLDDAHWVDGNADEETLHGRIGNEDGRNLGCSSIRDELARRCEESGCEESGFGQREKLTDRISGLLHDYNRPADVFTEHWQNADDAGAERLLFVVDWSTYASTSLVDHRAARLQGPALILACSNALSTADIIRIQALGDSHKRKDFSSVGRFGVGINTLYHMSDTPVLLANNTLHVFDPLQCAVASGTSTGRQFSISKLKNEGFADMLAPFTHLSSDKWPTVFRLPLRRKSADWKHALTVWPNVQAVYELLIDFAEGMNVEERLVLSKYVRFVEIGQKNEGGYQRHSRFECGSVTPAHALMQNLPKTLVEVQEILTKPRHVIAEMNISIVSGESSRSETSRWVVSHALEADSALLQLLEGEFGSGIALLPHGAVAFRFEAPRDYRGHWCCQLPLTDLAVGLPLMIHGFFDLSTSRKIVPLPNAHESDPSQQLRWNAQMLRGPVASSLVRLVKHVRDFIGHAGFSLKNYFELMELGGGEDTSAAALRRITLDSLLSRLLTSTEPVFPVTTHCREDPIKCWVRGRNLTLHASNLSVKAHDLLVNVDMKLVTLPRTLTDGLHKSALVAKLPGPMALNWADVCAHLAEHAQAVRCTLLNLSGRFRKYNIKRFLSV